MDDLFYYLSNMYFTEDFTKFFKGLAAHNDRDWFNDHKKDYEEYVKAPFQNLVADLIDATNSKLEIKDSVFRIYRDVRFSKDKTPYQLHVSAIVSDGGRKNMQIPGLYLHLSAEEHHIGGGMYSPDKENLMKIRKAIIANPKKLEKLLADEDFKRIYTTLKGDKNKILPKEIKGKDAGNPWVYNKQFYFMAEYHDEGIPLRKDLLEFILSHHRAGENFFNYFAKILS